MSVKNILLPAFMVISTALAAQQELMLQQSNALWSASSLNPAFFPKDKKIAVGLPSFGLDAAHSGSITYNDILVKQNGHTTLDFTGAIDKLAPENKVHYTHRFETLSLGIRLPAGFFVSGGHAIRQQTRVTYPKALAEVLWNGNGPYIGQTLEIAPQVEVFDFNELSLGAGFQTKKIQIGARIKYLSGISSLVSDPDHASASVYTDNDIYQLTLHTDYGFHSSSIISGIDTAGLGYSLQREVAKGKLFSQNTGKAVDLGLVLQLTERLSLNASVLDLGGTIKWSTHANYFLSQGDYTYNGVVFPGTDIINGADSIDFKTQLDTLNDIFKFAKTPSEFSTKLPVRYYLGGAYRFSDRWQFGASVFHQSGEQALTAVGVSAHWSVMKWLTLGALYGVNNRSATNIGFELAFTPGPVQLYFLSDNLGSAFAPYGSPAVNFRAGLGLVF